MLLLINMHECLTIISETEEVKMEMEGLRPREEKKNKSRRGGGQDNKRR